MSTEPKRVLRPADRCDSCGAQAFVRVELSPEMGELDLCGHHYARHEAALVAYPWTVNIIDERQWINARPSPSA